MAILRAAEPGPDGRRVVSVVDPATLAPLGEVELAGPDDARLAVQRARAAAADWAAAGFDARAQCLLRLRDCILDRREEVIDVVCGDTGKVRFEALAAEIFGSCDALTYYARRAEDLLRDERKRVHLFRHKRLVVRYRPLGVVGLLVPFNFPLLLALAPAAQALMAGNTVVLKPSDVTPRTGLLIEELIGEAGFPGGVMQAVVGDAEVGRALVDARCDKIAFTGSVANGREVAMACAQRLIPCTLELGGKDPLIVCDDADVERAARAAVWAAFFNSGQVCSSVERVYVTPGVAKAFIDRVVELTLELRQGPESEGEVDIGALAHEAQLEEVERHVADALSKGARVLTGGRRNPRWSGLFYEPTVMVDVDEKMAIMREETFGPCLPVRLVADEDEAIRLANASPYALQASVFTRDRFRARDLADRLDAAGIVIDDAGLSYSITELPHGGNKQSGMGRVNGELGLKSFCRVQTLVQPRLRLRREPSWYPYDEGRSRAVRRLLRLLYGTPLGRLLGG